MKATRRGFLGIMGGAAAAGPKLATSLASEAASRMPPPPSLGGYASGMDTRMPDAEYKRSRIAQLHKNLAGGKLAEHRRRGSIMYSLEQRDRFRLDGLRSVSPSHRHAMFIAGSVEREEAINRMYWEFELSELTGGIL